MESKADIRCLLQNEIFSLLGFQPANVTGNRILDLFPLLLLFLIIPSLILLYMNLSAKAHKKLLLRALLLQVCFLHCYKKVASYFGLARVTSFFRLL
jgi:hypothetical protein